MSEEKSETIDLGSFDFTPAWARKSAGVSVDHGRSGGGRGGDDGRERRSGGGKPSGDRRRFGDGKPMQRPFGDRGRPAREFRAPERPLDVDIKVLPEPKALGAIMRRIQQDIHAYKLKELAYFFLDNPSSMLLKVAPRLQSGGEGERQKFHQCRACGFAALDEGDVADHIVSAHLGDYYETREVACEPPSGNFNCVAKCGLSGELLGPPNVHEFNSVVREMIRTKYPNMTEDQYRSHIEMVRDPEAVEAWRKSRTSRTMFFAKGADENAQGMTREQAEAEFRRTILASLVDTPKNLSITADVALKSPFRPLSLAVRNALEAEMRNPYGICFALRGAFHHRKFKFFRANDARGPEFVTNVEYKEFDSAHAIPELASAAKFLEEHPCIDKSEFPPDGDFEKHLKWLVSTGHAVAFTNGVYSIVEKFPKYGPQWKNHRPKNEKPEASVAPEAQVVPETPDVTETPVVPETPVAPETPVSPEVPEKGASENETPAQLA